MITLLEIPAKSGVRIHTFGTLNELKLAARAAGKCGDDSMSVNAAIRYITANWDRFAILLGSHVVWDSTEPKPKTPLHQILAPQAECEAKP